jgi:hypothetical protein
MGDVAMSSGFGADPTSFRPVRRLPIRRRLTWLAGERRSMLAETRSRGWKDDRAWEKTDQRRREAGGS